MAEKTFDSSANEAWQRCQELVSLAGHFRAIGLQGPAELIARAASGVDDFIVVANAEVARLRAALAAAGQTSQNVIGQAVAAVELGTDDAPRFTADEAGNG